MSKSTREILIDVARKLFARKGIENTTMTDIADASDKGRRTVYTYFNNKEAIYEAVIERDSELMIEQLREVYALDLPPLEKFRRFIIARFDIFNKASAPGHVDSVRNLFRRDVRRYDRVVKMALSKERAMLNDLLRNCLDVPNIDRRQLARLKVVIPFLQQGIDRSFIRDNYATLGINAANTPDIVADFILNALVHKNRPSAPMSG